MIKNWKQFNESLEDEKEQIANKMNAEPTKQTEPFEGNPEDSANDILNTSNKGAQETFTKQIEQFEKNKKEINRQIIELDNIIKNNALSGQASTDPNYKKNLENNNKTMEERKKALEEKIKKFDDMLKYAKEQQDILAKNQEV